MDYRTGKVSNIRLQSAAGWYVGTLEFDDGEAQPYERDSMYYPSEEFLKKEYPNSISLKEAFLKAYGRKLCSLD